MGTSGGTASANCPPAGNCGVGSAQNQVTGISLAAGVAGVNYNFQEYAPATVSGTVYVDANNDGQLGGGESGINGSTSPVTIRITGTDYAGNTVNTHAGHQWQRLPTASPTWRPATAAATHADAGQ